MERCGVIRADGSIVEIRNSHPTPSDAFRMEVAELDKHEDIVATWHTHPKTIANLSSADYRMFQTQPKWDHYIVSKDEVRSYYVLNNRVMNHEDSF